MHFKIKYLAIWISLLCAPLVLLSCTGITNSRGGSGTEVTESQRYSAAKNDYNAKRYSSAITGFTQQLDVFPNGDLADNALLYLGRSHYWLTEYTTASVKFQLILSDYQSGDRLDAAQYWLAKTYHAQALVNPIFDENNAYTSAPFIAARIAYQDVTGTAYIDNAAYQIGRSHLEEAGMLTKLSPTIAVTNFEMARDALTSMIATYSISATVSTSVDDAQFYLGRSYHEFAVLLQKDSSLSTMLASDLMISAHANYTSTLIPSSSSFFDDAQYFDARAYHDQKDFINARLGYENIVTGGISNWLDDAAYQIGKTYYDVAVSEANLQIAIDTLILAITEFSNFAADPNYALSSRQDDTAFFKARSYHRQAAIIATGTMPTGAGIVIAADYFQNARLSYQTLFANFSNSGWRDNAQYQIGATYYDESELAEAIPDYPLMQQNISDAIQAFSVVTTDTVLQLLNSADNAQYYLGRSYHRIADLALIVPIIPLIDLSPTGGINLSQVNHQMARIEYTTLISNPIFSKSTWRDNAVYRQGKSFVSEANIELVNVMPDATIVVTNFNNAMTEFATLIAQFIESNRVDNSAYEIGLIYHDTCFRDQELLWFNYVFNAPKSSALLTDNAKTLHLDEPTTVSNNRLGCPAIPVYSIDTTLVPPML